MSENTFAHAILQEYWGFLDEGWPVFNPKAHHRSEIKPMKNMDHLRRVVLRRLGYIPVFFFLVMLWPLCEYPGPYSSVEKGLAFLYYLLKASTTEDMEAFLPRSSFYAIYEVFCRRSHSLVNRAVTRHLCTMFSNIQTRLYHAKANNPPLFRHITLLLDGLDTRASYGSEDRTLGYSYKLKKSGLRTQVCIDVQGMALVVSKSEPCSTGNDGTMLVDMRIHKHLHEMDCVGLDGAYTQYVSPIVDSTQLTHSNFAYPIRKKKGKELTPKEAAYNATFGGFRSMVEHTFGELGRMFEKHNNRAPVRVDKSKTYNLLLKVCLLLMNVKKFAALYNIQVLPHHKLWTEPGFDYPRSSKDLSAGVDQEVQDNQDFGVSLSKLQDEFLACQLEPLAGSDHSTREEDESMQEAEWIGEEDDSGLPVRVSKKQRS